MSTRVVAYAQAPAWASVLLSHFPEHEPQPAGFCVRQERFADSRSIRAVVPSMLALIAATLSDFPVFNNRRKRSTPPRSVRAIGNHGKHTAQSVMMGIVEHLGQEICFSPICTKI